MFTLGWIFTLHFLADFVCQPRWMAKQKSEQPAVLLLHVVIVQAIMALGLLFVTGPVSAVTFSLANAAVHGVTDMFSWRLYKRRVKKMFTNEEGELNVTGALEYPYWDDHQFWITLGADQLLHALALIVLANVLL